VVQRKALCSRRSLLKMSAGLTTWLFIAAPSVWCAASQAASSAGGVTAPPGYEKEIAAAMQLPVGDDRLQAFIKVGIDWSQKEPVEAMRWSSKLSKDLFPPNPTAQVPMKVSYALGATKNARIVADWFISPQCDANEKPHWFYDLIQMWGEVDTDAALAWSQHLPNGTDAGMRYKCFLALGNGWMMKVRKSGGRIDACELFSKLDSEPDRLAAIMGAALKETDIATATAWIKKLRPNEARLAATMRAQNWQKTFAKDGQRDDEALKKWLDNLPLSEADKQEVINNRKRFQWVPEVLNPYKSNSGK
jgi:hypothetical protein